MHTEKKLLFYPCKEFWVLYFSVLKYLFDSSLYLLILARTFSLICFKYAYNCSLKLFSPQRMVAFKFFSDNFNVCFFSVLASIFPPLIQAETILVLRRWVIFQFLDILYIMRLRILFKSFCFSTDTIYDVASWALLHYFQADEKSWLPIWTSHALWRKWVCLITARWGWKCRLPMCVLVSSDMMGQGVGDAEGISFPLASV